MTTYYKATFSDGTVVKRATAGRKYAFAWLARRRYTDRTGASGISECHGFSATETNAQAQLRRFAYGDMILAEIAPAVEITRAEHGKQVSERDA